MRVRARAVDSNRTSLLRRVALSVDQTLVLATPVDKGRARANWVVSLNKPFRGEVTEFPEGEAGGSQAIKQGREALSVLDPATRVVYISNNLPYIRRLNDGWSAQAPAGFVEEAVAAGVRAVEGARLLR